METIVFSVRTGEGTVLNNGKFSDEISRTSGRLRHHAGWQSVRYKGRRYQLFGGVRTGFFICLNNPVKGNMS